MSEYINETDEPADVEAAVEYWRGRWADTASVLMDALGVIQDITDHATPIASDTEGFVSVGYTVTVGAIHRATGWLVATAHNRAGRDWPAGGAS